MIDAIVEARASIRQRVMSQGARPATAPGAIRKKSADPINVDDWTRYIKKDTALYTTGADLFSEPYGPQTVDSLPKVSDSTYNALSDVTDAAFWSPYH